GLDLLPGPRPLPVAAGALQVAARRARLPPPQPGGARPDARRGAGLDRPARGAARAVPQGRSDDAGGPALADALRRGQRRSAESARQGLRRLVHRAATGLSLALAGVSAPASISRQ